MKRVVAIHTTPATIPGIKDICTNMIKNCEVVNMLDDSMLPEINREGYIPEDVKYRFFSMIMMAASTKPDAIICACSSIGGLIDSGRCITDVPLFRIDEPMAAEAVERGSKIGVAATLASTINPTKELIIRKARESGKEISLECRVIEGAGRLLSEGRMDEYDEIIASNLKELLLNNDVVALAQASMARAVSIMDEKLKCKVLTSPESGVKAMSKFLGE